MITTDKYVLFWGEEDIYSNFYPAQFDMEGHHFYWSEQSYMWLKAISFSDTETANDILKMCNVNNTPIQCKKLGRQVKNFDPEVWKLKCIPAMYLAVQHKFAQNSWLSKQLLDTENKVLVEASPYDKIWGIGLAEGDPEAQDESKWKGTNLLGKVLMDVRKELRTI